MACHKNSRQESVGLRMWPVTNTARVSGSPDVACHKHSKSQWVSGRGLSQTQQESVGLRTWPVTNTARVSGSPDVACHKHSKSQWVSGRGLSQTQQPAVSGSLDVACHKHCRQQSEGLWKWPVTNTADSSQWVSFCWQRSLLDWKWPATNTADQNQGGRGRFSLPVQSEQINLYCSVIQWVSLKRSWT